jgi:hypothetical protein
VLDAAAGGRSAGLGPQSVGRRSICRPGSSASAIHRAGESGRDEEPGALARGGVTGGRREGEHGSGTGWAGVRLPASISTRRRIAGKLDAPEAWELDRPAV